MPIGIGGAALIGAGADIIGGLLGKKGQSSANQANLQIARENREWQERMSSTAYQRAAKDLDAAGLNRILAIGSPSSTPAGNVATMENVEKPLQEGIHKGVGTALQASLMRQQIKNMEEQRKLTEAQRKVIAPATEAGETIGSAIDAGKNRLSPDRIDYRNLGSELMDDIKKGASSAKQKITEIAESVNINPFKARRELIAVVKQMDLPPMTEPEMYKWALQNPEKIKAFLERKRQRGMN